MWVFASTFVPIYRSLHFWLVSPWVPRPTSTSSSSRAQKILLRFRTRLLRKSNRFPSVLSARRPMISFPRVLPYNPSARKEYRKRKRPSAPPQNPHHPAHHAENVVGEGIPNQNRRGTATTVAITASATVIMRVDYDSDQSAGPIVLDILVISEQFQAGWRLDAHCSPNRCSTFWTEAGVGLKFAATFPAIDQCLRASKCGFPWLKLIQSS